MSDIPKNSASPVASWSRRTSVSAQSTASDTLASQAPVPVQRPRLSALSFTDPSQGTTQRSSSTASNSQQQHQHVDTTAAYFSAGREATPTFTIQSPLKRPTGAPFGGAVSSRGDAQRPTGFATPPPPPSRAASTADSHQPSNGEFLLPTTFQQQHTPSATYESFQREGRGSAAPTRTGSMQQPLQTTWQLPTAAAATPGTRSGGAPSDLSGAVSSSSAVSAAKPIPETAFISDILFLWMGVERTKYFCFDAPAGTFVMSHSTDGTLRQRQTLKQLQECGVLVLEIESMLKRGTADLSFLQQSLRAALRSQMTQYHYFVSTLRERVETLTLADVVVAHKKVLPKLSTISLMLTETANAKGGELVSRMHSLVLQGSRRLAEFVHAIHIETVTPLLQMAAEWIVKGDVADPFHEFFVKVNVSVDINSDAFWSHRFALELTMLPTTVPREVAEGILRVGRNIALITKCCRAKNWRMDPAIAAKAQQHATFATLPKLVEEALAYTNKAVMQLVHEKSRLLQVLYVVQDFLLVGHGEFFENLIRKLDPLMTKQVSSVQASVVADHVQMALLEATAFNTFSSSSAAGGASSEHAATFAAGSDDNKRRSLRADSADIVHQIESEMVKVDKSTGWDCFSLGLPLPTPLNNLFDAESRRAYRRLFKTLFSVKRAEVALKESWRQSVILDRLLVRAMRNHNVNDPDPELAVWRKVAGDAHLLGLQFNHFVNNLWSYFVSEVSTTAWERLRRALGVCKSFDELREAHTAYVQQLSLFSLLHVECRDVRGHITSILGLSRELCAAQAQLTNLFEHNVGNIISISGEYLRIADEFERHMTSLLRLLEEHHMRFDFLNFLLLRLNFNQFYRKDAASDVASNAEF